MNDTHQRLNQCIAALRRENPDWGAFAAALRPGLARDARSDPKACASYFLFWQSAAVAGARALELLLASKADKPKRLYEMWLSSAGSRQNARLFDSWKEALGAYCALPGARPEKLGGWIDAFDCAFSGDLRWLEALSFRCGPKLHWRKAVQLAALANWKTSSSPAAKARFVAEAALLCAPKFDQAGLDAMLAEFARSYPRSEPLLACLDAGAAPQGPRAASACAAALAAAGRLADARRMEPLLPQAPSHCAAALDPLSEAVFRRLAVCRAKDWQADAGLLAQAALSLAESRAPSGAPEAARWLALAAGGTDSLSLFERLAESFRSAGVRLTGKNKAPFHALMRNANFEDRPRALQLLESLGAKWKMSDPLLALSLKGPEMARLEELHLSQSVPYNPAQNAKSQGL